MDHFRQYCTQEMEVRVIDGGAMNGGVLRPDTLFG